MFDVGAHALHMKPYTVAQTHTHVYVVVSVMHAWTHGNTHFYTFKNCIIYSTSLWCFACYNDSQIWPSNRLIRTRHVRWQTRFQCYQQRRNISRFIGYCTLNEISAYTRITGMTDTVGIIRLERVHAKWKNNKQNNYSLCHVALTTVNYI